MREKLIAHSEKWSSAYQRKSFTFWWALDDVCPRPLVRAPEWFLTRQVHCLFCCRSTWVTRLDHFLLLKYFWQPTFQGNLAPCQQNQSSDANANLKSNHISKMRRLELKSKEMAAMLQKLSRRQHFMTLWLRGKNIQMKKSSRSILRGGFSVRYRQKHPVRWVWLYVAAT